jgi:peptidoglycan/LPS O-acetylase OafA/YrhL
VHTEPQTRFAFLDVLRILAIFGVLMAHWSWSPNWVEQVFADDPESVFGDLTFLSRYGFLGVHLFFMISGAVILKSARRRTAVSFIRARMIRIMPLYLIAIVMSAVIEYLHETRETSEILMRALKSLVFLASSKDDSWINPVFWTLKIEDLST